MALPNLRSGFMSARNFYESAVFKRRANEDKFQNLVNSYNNYFKKADIITTYQNNWTSDNSFNSSLSSYLQPDKEFLESNIQNRRAKLSALFCDENEQYEMKIGLKLSQNRDVEDMEKKCKSLKMEKDSRRHKEALPLTKEYFIKNDPYVSDYFRITDKNQNALKEQIDTKNQTRDGRNMKKARIPMENRT